MRGALLGGAAIACLVLVAVYVEVASIREESRRELAELRSSHEADRRQLLDELVSANRAREEERRQHI